MTMAANEFVTISIPYLTRRGVLHRISQLRDLQKVASSRDDLTPARDSNIIPALDQKLREPN